MQHNYGTTMGKWMSAFLAMVLVGAVFANECRAMGRTIKEEPAIVVVAFGTTTRAKATYEFFDRQLRKELSPAHRDLKIAWAFTSEIVRERANRRFEQQGAKERFLSLAQVLANLEDQGYRRVAVQPLHIFPGQEYQEMERVIGAFRTLGLRIEYGGALFHEWPMVFAAMEALSAQFLPEGEGANLLVVHGTPQTFPGSNATYLGLARYLDHRYPNVFIGGVDGVLTREQALDKVKAYPVKKVRIIPCMFVAGDHIMNDIMGEEPDSWASELKAAGLEVEAVETAFDGARYFKGLGFYPELNRIFIEQLDESLERLEAN